MSRGHHAAKATGKGDPQMYKGEAGGPPRFKVGDRVRVKDLPDVFYTRCQYYIRGAVGTIATVTHESPAAEDEAWDNTSKVVWFYMVRFPQKEVWPEYSPAYPNDTVQTEVCEPWLEPA